MSNLYDVAKSSTIPSVGYPKMYGTLDTPTFLELGLMYPLTAYQIPNPNSNGWWSGLAGNDMSAYGSLSYSDGGAISKYDKNGVKPWVSTACAYGLGYPVEGNGYLYSVSNNTIIPVNTSTGAAGTTSLTIANLTAAIGFYNPSIYYVNTTYKVVRVSTNGSAQPQAAAISTALTNITMNNNTNVCIRGNYMYLGYLISSTTFYISKFDISAAGFESLVWSYSVASTVNYAITADDWGNAYYFTGSNLVKVNNTGVLASVSLTANVSYLELTTTDDYVILDNVSYNYFYVYDFKLNQLKVSTSMGTGLYQGGASGNRRYFTYRSGSSYMMALKCMQTTLA